MQFNSFVIDDLGQTQLPETPDGLKTVPAQVASGGATISGDYLQAGEGEPISGDCKFGKTPSLGNSIVFRLLAAQLAGGLEIVCGQTEWPPQVRIAFSGKYRG